MLTLPMIWSLGALIVRAFFRRRSFLILMALRQLSVKPILLSNSRIRSFCAWACHENSAATNSGAAAIVSLRELVVWSLYLTFVEQRSEHECAFWGSWCSH